MTTNLLPIAPESPEAVVITCADGERLGGRFMPACGGTPGLPVLLCPATGAKQQFYLRFAQWLAGQGHDVLVFDYRGIGESRHGPLKDCKATLAQWGQQDLVAALDWLLRRTGSQQVVQVGHSAGGQMIGLMPNHHRVARLVGIAASTGWFGGLRLAFRLQAWFAFHFFLPIGTRLLGYAPTARVGLGENLPAAVARQWGQWCAAGGYATNAARGRTSEDFHADVRTPITVLYAEDDDIANATTVAALLRTLPNAPSQVIAVRPADRGLKDLGHMNWFRKSHEAVWPLMAQAVRGTATSA